MPWYDGSPLLSHLERLHVASDRNLVDVRFPVQYVIRPQQHDVLDYRGYAGTVASGVLKPGDRGRGPAVGPRVDDREDPHRRRRGRRGLPADGGHDHARRRARHLARRHALPAAQHADGRAGHRRAGLLDGRDGAARQGRASTGSSTRPAGPGRWSASSTTGSTSTRSTATRAPTELVAQRDRAGPAAGDPAAVRRPLPAEPRRRARSSWSTRARTGRSAAGMIGRLQGG